VNSGYVILQFGQNILSVNRWISLSLLSHTQDSHTSFHSAQDDDFLDDFFDVISIFESQVFSTFETEVDSHDLSIT
jgi:hypothetical protein